MEHFQKFLGLKLDLEDYTQYLEKVCIEHGRLLIIVRIGFPLLLSCKVAWGGYRVEVIYSEA